MWFGLDLDSWNNLIVAFGVLSGIFVLFTGAATYIAFQLQKQETAIAAGNLEHYKLIMTEKLAAAGGTAANALMRAANLENDAANSRLETERLKTLTAWRRVKFPERLMHDLSSHPGTVYFRFVANDPETTYFALQLSKAFELSHWKVSGFMPTIYSGSFVYGVAVPGDGRDAKNIRDAFHVAGIEFSTGSVAGGHLTISGNGLQFGTAPEPLGTLVVVGPKKPAF